MKVIFFIIALLNFTYILSTQELINTEEEYDDDYVIGDGQVKCADEKVAFPNDEYHNLTSYDYCRSLHFDKKTYYRCCYAKSDDGDGCVLTDYSDFESEDNIKKKIEGYSNAKIDCYAKYLGVSLFALFIALF